MKRITIFNLKNRLITNECSYISQMSFYKSEFDPSLSYDDAAFTYFVSTLLLISLVVIVCFIVQDIQSTTIRDYEMLSKGKWFCKQLSNTQLQLATIYRSRKFIIKILLLILLIIGCIYTIHKASLTPLRSISFHQILGVGETATERQLKQAYNDLVKQYHPDKYKKINKKQQSAEQGDNIMNIHHKFNLIVNAYKCLTVEKYKESCAKYGSPDQQHSTKVSIALPTIAVEYQYYVLTVLLLFLFVALPYIFVRWSQNYNILQDYPMLAAFMDKEGDITDEEIVQALCQLKSMQGYSRKRIEKESRVQKVIESGLKQILQFSIIYGKKEKKNKKLHKDLEIIVHFRGVNNVYNIIKFMRRIYNKKQIQLNNKCKLEKQVQNNEVNTGRQQQNVLKQSNMPRMRLQIKMTVEDIEQYKIYKTDHTVIHYIITKQTPNIPYCAMEDSFKQQIFYVIITNKNNIIHFNQVRLTGVSSKFSFDYKQSVARVMCFDAVVMSDFYFGIDVSAQLHFQVVDEVLQDRIHLHPTDRQFLKGYKTLMESLFEGSQDDYQLSDEQM